MDVNRTRLHLVYGKQDWLTPNAPGFEYQRGSLTLQRLPFVYPDRRSERPPTPEDRRGAGRDRYGNWYWIAPDKLSIRFGGHEAEVSQHFWAATDRPVRCDRSDGGAFFSDCEPAPPLPRALAGLAVTSNHYLLAGAHDHSALLVFDLHDGGPPLELAWPAAGEFTPFDIAPTVDGGAWLLDRVKGTYLGIDCYLRFIGAPVAPSAGGPAFREDGQSGVAPPAAGVTEGVVKPFALTGVADPIAIECLPDGSVLVLDAGGSASVVHRFLNGERVGDPATLVLSGGAVAAIPLRGHDLAFEPADARHPDVNGLVYVTAANGNQTFALRTRPEQRIIVGDPEPLYYPMRLAAGKGLVATAEGPYYDLDDRWIPLAEQPLPRYRATATLQLPRPADRDDHRSFDGGQPRCVWHRLMIDACIPPGTSVRVESRTAEDPDLLAPDSATPWHTEPPFYLRRDGSEIPFYQTPLVGNAEYTGTWELLFQRAIGQYLQLRITLTGAGRNTPRIHALRAYYPRFSYLREYLPTVYREDEESASFLDRFLANVEGFYTAVEGRIEQAQALFDPRTVPAEYLEWLATWFGATLDPAWDDHTRRLFLAHAYRLFLERGTLRGVTRAVRLAMDPCADESAFTDACGCGCGESSPFQVRITEGFLSLPPVDGAPLEDAAGAGQTIAAKWAATHGSVVHARFAAFLERQYETVERLNESWASLLNDFSEVRFSPLHPAHDVRRRDWSAFARAEFSFPYYQAAAADEPQWRRFLARRYPQVSDLRRTWGIGAFEEVHLPAELPSGAALADWMEFVSSVLPVQRRAHYFTVLVPADIADGDEVHAARLDLARRVTAAVKPAHTDFDVALYWALFRVGEVRVGVDTVIGYGSRFVSIVLGRTPLADGVLTAPTAGRQLDRFITGRDPLRAPRSSTRGSVS